MVTDALILDGIVNLGKDLNMAKFTQNLALFGIAWVVIKGSIKKTFSAIELSIDTFTAKLSVLDSIDTKIEHLSQTLVQIELSHAERLEKLERDVRFVKNKLNEGIKDA